MQHESVAIPTRPAPGAGHAYTHNLPVQLTPFFGREHELVDISTLLRRPEVRLLTLTGTGGVGKTRLGLAAARTVQDTFPDGVYFVPLAPVSDPERVIATIAQTLSWWESGDRPLLEQVQDYLREKHLLLLLDNFEQVIAAAAALCYLRSCLNGAIVDTLRAYSRAKEVVLPEPGFPDEPTVEDHEEEDQRLWEAIQDMLPNERERRLAYLLFHCNLKPREIVRRCPQEFSEVQEIYRLRRNITGRLLRDSDQFRWKMTCEQ